MSNKDIPTDPKRRKEWLRKKAREAVDGQPIFVPDEPQTIGHPRNLSDEESEDEDKEE